MSIYGEIASAWKIDENGWMVYLVEIPANTTATVTLSAVKLENVKANSVSENEELLSGGKQLGDDVNFEIGSGKYQFSYRVE